uniref:hypothetical protein n=1 Tax=Magnusiomyces suaveolens TaxID=44074 RepID=UPI001BEF6478
KEPAFATNKGIKLNYLKYTMDEKKSKFTSDEWNEYVKMFWVGLMDGDGSIQTNYWVSKDKKSKSMQYRMMIQLKNLPSNYKMLVEMSKILKGSVRITNKSEKVMWVMDDRDQMYNLIREVYYKYPPLQYRRYYQLKFMLLCMHLKDYDFYTNNRNNKFDTNLYENYKDFFKNESLIYYNGFNNLYNSNMYTLDYYKGWLSGFMEAESSFSLRTTNNNHSFSMSQDNEYDLMQSMVLFFNMKNQIRNPYKNFYMIEVYRRSVTLNMYHHLMEYPLLGNKNEQMTKFYTHIFTIPGKKKI